MCDVSAVLPRNHSASGVISYSTQHRTQDEMTPPMIEKIPGHYVILDHGRPIGEVPLPSTPPRVGVGEKTVLLILRPYQE